MTGRVKTWPVFYWRDDSAIADTITLPSKLPGAGRGNFSRPVLVGQDVGLKIRQMRVPA